jgi:hypothetical protein
MHTRYFSGRLEGKERKLLELLGAIQQPRAFQIRLSLSLRFFLIANSSQEKLWEILTHVMLGYLRISTSAYYSHRVIYHPNLSPPAG